MPVPEAHLSLSRKVRTFLASSMRLAFIVCPPMSRIVRVPGNSSAAPRAAAVRSVTCRSRSSTWWRPKPVVMQ
jgi:hypothetical protein